MRLIEKILYTSLITMIVSTSMILSGCVEPSLNDNTILNIFEVHEWGVFEHVYNSNIVNVVNEPVIGPVIVKKPVIYFHYDENLSDIVIEVDINGDILVTIPDAVNTSNGINWTFDIVNNSVVAPNGTVYDYLFYECQINVTQGIVAYVVEDGINITFYVENVADYSISDIFFIYGYSTDISIWSRGLSYVHIDTLESGEETSITIPLKNNSSYDTDEIFSSLIENGLTANEAKELIDYWQEMWFHPTNIGTYAQMIYTIPEEIYNDLLPISIIPTPEIINRVGLFFVTGIPINPSDRN
ncbi:hypothetical protein ACFL1L_03060 [Thermoplasmatota archaeon]